MLRVASRLCCSITSLRLDPLCSGRDLAGFYIGLASIFCWFVAQVPQLVKNYKCKSADALSAWFLAQWLLVRLAVAQPPLLAPLAATGCVSEGALGAQR